METKTCSRCKEDKPTKEFSRNKRAGFHAYCKCCDREVRQARRYNLTTEEFYKMYYKQKGCCAICGTHGPLHTDHQHSTGNVRGLLCQGCNVGLGHFMESPERLNNAIKYLKGE